MIRNWKSASVGVSLVLAVSALGLYGYTRAHAAPTYTLANGIEVTPTVVEPDEVGKLLEMKFWKIDVVQTNENTSPSFNLSLCRNGKVTRGLTYTYGGVPVSRKFVPVHYHIPVTVGLVPVGNTFFEAKQLKYSISAQGMNTTGVMPNIFFKTQGFMTDTWHPMVSTQGNVVFLLSANKNTPTTSDPMRNDTTLALGIVTMPAGH